MTFTNTCIGLWAYDGSSVPVYSHATNQFNVYLNFTLNTTLDTNTLEIRSTEFERGHLYESLNMTFEKSNGDRTTTQNYQITDFSCNRNDTGMFVYNYTYDLVEDVKSIRVNLKSKDCDFGAENYVLRMEELNFSYYNFTNYLPQVNISISGNQSSFCLDENGTVSVPLNISANDANGDTILYSLNKVSYTNTTHRVKFQEQPFCILNFCAARPDYSSIVNLSLGCPVNKQDFLPTLNLFALYNPLVNNIIPYLNPFSAEEEYMLELNGNCVSEGGYYHQLQNTIANYFYVELFIDNNEIFNVTYKDYALTDLFTISLHHNTSQGLVFVFINDTEIGNVTSFSTKYVNLRIDPRTDAYVIQYGANRSIYKETTFDRNPYGDLVSYLYMSNTGKVVIRDFIYSSKQAIPSFSEIPPNSIEFTSTGPKQLILYYTDSLHLNPLQYNAVTMPVQIWDSDQCGYITGKGIGKPDLAIERVDVLGMIKGVFGKSLKGYLQTLGYYDIGEKLLWFAFVILLVILLILTLNVGIALLLSTLAVGFLALMVDYTVLLISMLILMALGLASLFLPGIGGNR